MGSTASRATVPVFVCHVAVGSLKDWFRFKVLSQKTNKTMQLRVNLEAEFGQQPEREPLKARTGRNQNMSFVHNWKT